MNDPSMEEEYLDVATDDDDDEYGNKNSVQMRTFKRKSNVERSHSEDDDEKDEDDNLLSSQDSDDGDGGDDMESVLLDNGSDLVIDSEGEEEVENYWDVPIWRQVSNRLPLLLALLLLQSASSFILKEFEGLVEKHFVITMYLTMLVGTGGNAGGQSAATALQGLANGQIMKRHTFTLLIRELTISVAISLVIGFVGFWRVFLMTSNATVVDGIAVSLSLVFIVITSIIVGAGLPMLMDYLMHLLRRYAEKWSRMLDPANTTFPVFQVVMDILGILIVCGTCTVIYAISDDSVTECKCHCSHTSGAIWDIEECSAVGQLIPTHQ
jgi:cation transporter-like permease